MKIVMYNKELVQKICEYKIPCYFISPHLDDAALSAGGLIAYLAHSAVPVMVVTIFTKNAPPDTLSARKFLKTCGFGGDGAALFKARAEEDRVAFSILNIKPVHLGFIDALWRKIQSPSLIRRLLGYIFPEFIHVYPIYRWLIASNTISHRDRALKSEIKSTLLHLTRNANNYYVFCPIGLNSHVDHTLTRDVCLNAFGHRTILWSDFPYNLRDRKADDMYVEEFEWEANFEEKKAMILEYKSQLNGLFPDGKIARMPEIYYTLRL